MQGDYSDAAIRAIDFCPRRELRLELEIAGNWRSSVTDISLGTRRFAVRFGGIANYEEVIEAFSGIPLHASLHSLEEPPESKATRRLIDLEVDRTEHRVRIIASSVREEPLDAGASHGRQR